MAKYASKVVAQIQSWLGYNESDGTHKKIIDIYNSHKPLARGYAVQYTDEWCATTVSAVAVALGYTDIIPTECSCSKMVELFKKLGAWDENDSRKPNPGDIVFYDWNDNGVGDNTGSPDHVGIVEKVSGTTITVIEGNKDEGVNRRTLKVNGKYIRGYGVPKYDAEPVKQPKPTTSTTQKGVCTVEIKQLQKGSTGNTVKALQLLLIGYGISCGRWGADGSFGDATVTAVKSYQSKKGLSVDGIVGTNTWNKLLGVN